ncbi:MAG: DegT/DnrJ/EryC1/StrS family aminotransferase [Dehalococcoidia bacterium]|nr:DegT/DnrJ/EryC1/StrS family aminotransferase [Dehalococcoidia bacterium]
MHRERFANLVGEVQPPEPARHPAPIPFNRPSIDAADIDEVVATLRSGWLTSGPRVREFEQRFAEYVGAKYAIGLNSATAALHLSVAALGIGAGDEVLVPTMTFVSTAHAAMYCGATPVFVDIRPDTLCIDPEDARRKITPRTRAIMPVHYGGHACEMEEIWSLAEDHGLRVIEDAAHACGSQYKGVKVGGLSRTDATCFSFHAVKNLATGDGGMVTTDRVELVQAFKRLRWVGIDKSTWDRTEEVQIEKEAGVRRFAKYGWYYEVHELGYKCHMNDIIAAIGLVQLGKLDRMNARRREIAGQYTAAFEGVEWIERPVEKEYTSSAMHNYVIKTPFRDDLNLYLKEVGIASGVHYMPIHLQPYYRQRFRVSLPVEEQVWTRILTLPLYPDLTDDQVDYLIESILGFGKTLGRRE